MRNDPKSIMEEVAKISIKNKERTQTEYWCILGGKLQVVSDSGENADDFLNGFVARNVRAGNTPSGSIQEIESEFASVRRFFILHVTGTPGNRAGWMCNSEVLYEDDGKDGIFLLIPSGESGPIQIGE